MKVVEKSGCNDFRIFQETVVLSPCSGPPIRDAPSNTNICALTKKYRRYRGHGVSRSVRKVSLPPTLRHTARAPLSDLPSQATTSGDSKRNPLSLAWHRR